MTDIYSKEKRSEIMARINGKDTKPELMVRKWLFANGFRFRKNDRRYPGTPDVLLPKYKTAIFIHGCFWHSHEGCKYAYKPKTRIEFWREKLEKNKIRDTVKEDKLRQLGFKVIIIWECELKKHFQERLNLLIDQINPD